MYELQHKGTDDWIGISEQEALYHLTKGYYQPELALKVVNEGTSVETSRVVVRRKGTPKRKEPRPGYLGEAGLMRVPGQPI